MTGFSHVAAVALALSALAACGAPPPPPRASQLVNPVASREGLSRIVERYWDEHIALAGVISPQGMADSLAVEKRFLADIAGVPRAALDENSRLTYDIFKRQRELAVQGFTYPGELLAPDPFSSEPVELAQLATDLGQEPLPAAKDYEGWMGRIDAYVAWTGQAIANMREGMRRGYTSPRAVIERSLPVLARMGEDTPANVFYLPPQTLPASIKEPERARLAADLAGAVKGKLLPANRALHDFLQREYLPAARRGLGLSQLPLGAAWYAYRVRAATDSTLTPKEIHALGLAEVDRIRARMPATVTGVLAPGGAGITTAAGGANGAAGGANGPAGGGSAGDANVTAGASASVAAAALLSAYADLKSRTLEALPSLFAAVPPVDFEIRVQAPGAAPTALFYRPEGPGAVRTAILYVDGGASAGRPAAPLRGEFLRQAIPGRHYQRALQQARSDLPRFRRFGTDPAFVEGWALYAASLGEELGLYADDEARRGALLAQMECATALVVDTGLHARGWTRAQALDYVRAQLGVDEAGGNAMIDRFAALPAQGLACKMGELKFRALRSRAQQELGTRFDIKEFHSVLLDGGAMPLDLLEAKLTLWMEGRR